MYQLGDGFFIRFDRAALRDRHCFGKPIDVVELAVLISPRFLYHHDGILRIGIAEGEFSGHSHGSYVFKNRKNGCGYLLWRGTIFVLPVMGALLAEAYLLTQKSNSKTSRHEPRVWIHSDLYSLLNDIRSDLEEDSYQRSANEKQSVWSYTNLMNPSDHIKARYKEVFESAWHLFFFLFHFWKAHR